MFEMPIKHCLPKAAKMRRVAVAGTWWREGQTVSGRGVVRALAQGSGLPSSGSRLLGPQLRPRTGPFFARTTTGLYRRLSTAANAGAHPEDKHQQPEEAEDAVFENRFAAISILIFNYLF
jgi:hypothetical protein